MQKKWLVEKLADNHWVVLTPSRAVYGVYPHFSDAISFAQRGAHRLGLSTRPTWRDRYNETARANG